MADAADPELGLFDWAEEARLLARGKHYAGGSSAWWYGADDLWALLQSAGDQPVIRQLAELEGYL